MSAIVPTKSTPKAFINAFQNPAPVNRHSNCFELLLVFSQISAILMFASGGFMFGTVNFGLQWHGNEEDLGKKGNASGNLNIHGLLMSTGAVLLRGEALLAFRLFRHEPQVVAMCVHLLFYLLSLLVPAGGLYSIYTQKYLAKVPHLSSAHSWMGCALIVANLLHFLIGFSTWLSTKTLRRKIVPKQRLFSIGLFLCSVGQLIGGIAQFEQVAMARCSPTCPFHEDLLLNVFPLCSIAYAAFVILLLKNENWRSISSDKTWKNK